MGRGCWTMLDTVAGILVVMLLTAFATSAIVVEREANNRVRCAKNLKEIGSGLLLYANENRKAYPRTLADAVSPPTWGTPYDGDDAPGAVEGADAFAAEGSRVARTRPKPNDVTAALYLLLRTQDLRASAFVCPSSGRTAWDFSGRDHAASEWTNWRGKGGLRAHLSYSYANPYPTTDAAIRSGYKLNNVLSPEFAVAADMNPGGTAITKVTYRSDREAIKSANSLNHARAGQNVLFGDGRVEFVESPFVGGARDHIYTYGGTSERSGGDGVVGSPVFVTDSVLLPTAADIGQGEAEILKAARPGPALLSAEEQKRLRARVMGRYVRREGGGQALDIGEDRLSPGGTAAGAGFPYEIRGVVDDTIFATVRARGVDPVDVTLTPVDGGVRVEGPSSFSGEWIKRE